jgi:hypothetical protein
VLLDVRYHRLVARQMPPWVAMIRIGKIATEYRTLMPVDELPDSVWAAEHAAIRVNARDEDVIDLTFLEQRVKLFAPVGDGIVQGYMDGVYLLTPRIRWAT